MFQTKKALTNIWLMLLYPERESNPHGRNGHRIFVPTTAFAAPLNADLWSGLSLHLIDYDLDAPRQVSTPFRLRRTWLGIINPPEAEKTSPSLRSSTSEVSLRALKLL